MELAFRNSTTLPIISTSKIEYFFWCLYCNAFRTACEVRTILWPGYFQVTGKIFHSHSTGGFKAVYRQTTSGTRHHKKRKPPARNGFLYGAGDRTWTCTVNYQILNLARLPIPPRPRINVLLILYKMAHAVKGYANFIKKLLNRIW